jgi:DinB superfamily
MGLAHSTVSLLDSLWPRVRGRLEGLTDHEYLWEPVPGCWSVRRQGDIWEIERENPPPDPPPLTTIAWRTWHIGSECVNGFCQLAFETTALDLAEREWFPSAAAALQALDKAWTAFSRGFHELDDTAMNRELGPAFGPYATSNHADLLLHVADEVIHHGAEVALLRDLFAAQRLRSPAQPDRIMP